MQRQRDLDDGNGTIVTVSTPIWPAPLHRRPRTDQRLLSAAHEALPLTEMHLRSLSGLSRACSADRDEGLLAAARFARAPEPTGGWPASASAQQQRDTANRMPLGLLHDGERRHAWFATFCEA